MNDTNTTYDTAVRDADFDDFADSATAVTSDASDADEIATTLAQWWQTNARDLPWRFGRTTPWGVLVSEVMSQQTQMGRVVPYWTAWMDRWPDAAALADAPKSDVITAWGRLGYPRRALRLQECAHVIAYDYADELPHTYDELLALPGIGDYTASAVLSFAFGERIAVVDTNIRRVLSRAFVGVESLGGSASPAERALAKRLLPDDDSARRDGVHCEIAIMRSLSDRRKMCVPTQRKTGIGAAAYATTPTIPRYGPAGARAGAERAARPAGWRDGA